MSSRINSSKPTTFPSGIVVKRAAFRTTYMAFSRWSKRRTRFKECRVGDQIADERDRATPKGWNHLSVTTTCRFQPPFRIGFKGKTSPKNPCFFFFKSMVFTLIFFHWSMDQSAPWISPVTSPGHGAVSQSRLVRSRPRMGMAAGGYNRKIASSS